MEKKVSRIPKVRALLTEAAEQLDKSRQSLFQAEPDYAASLRGSHQAIRRAFQAFITWHGLALPESTPLSALIRRAVPLASILTTYEHLALPVEPLADELVGRCDCSEVNNREAIERGCYTARNTYHTVLGELPADVRPAAVASSS